MFFTGNRDIPGKESPGIGDVSEKSAIPAFNLLRAGKMAPTTKVSGSSQYGSGNDRGAGFPGQGSMTSALIQRVLPNTL